MVKSVFLILLMLNLGVLAFFTFSDESLPNRKVERVILQINPSEIKLVNDGILEEDKKQIIYTNNDVATCVEGNLANEAEVLFLQKELQNTLSNVQTKIISTTQDGSYVLYVSAKNIKTQVAELRRLKIIPISTGVVDKKSVAVLGVFNNKPRAIEYQDSLKSKGVKGSEIKLIQDSSINVFWLRLPYATIEEEGLMRKISARYGIMTRYCQ